MSDQKVQIVSILQETFKILEEAQETIQKCNLEQIEIIQENTTLLEKIKELEAKVSFLESSRKNSYLEHKNEIFDQIKKSGLSILFNYDSYDISMYQWIDHNEKTIFSDPLIMNYIIDHTDFEKKDDIGWNPFHYICRLENLKMIQHAIKKGADIEAGTILGSKPIHFICASADEETIRFFIDKGVDLECSTSIGWKPIHYLCQRKFYNIIDYIQKRVDMNCVTHNGETPIYLLTKQLLKK